MTESEYVTSENKIQIYLARDLLRQVIMGGVYGERVKKMAYELEAIGAALQKELEIEE